MPAISVELWHRGDRRRRSTRADLEDGRPRRKLRNGWGIAVRYTEADASFPIVSNWFAFGPGGQAMVGQSLDKELRQIVNSEEVVQLEKQRSVYWLLR